MISHIEYLMCGKMVEELKGQAIMTSWAMRSFEIVFFFCMKEEQQAKRKGQFWRYFFTAVTTDTTANINSSLGMLLEDKGTRHLIDCAYHEMHNICKQAYNKNSRTSYILVQHTSALLLQSSFQTPLSKAENLMLQ